MTDQTELKKVIRGLEICSSAMDAIHCLECPYKPLGKLCKLAEMRDALALLREDRKAQESRVVAISELTSGDPMLVWLEDIDKAETVAGMLFDYYVPGRLGFKLTDIGSMDRIYPCIGDYLMRWRCWTSRPDEKRRAETPWESVK